MRLIDADALLDDLRKNTSTYVENFVKKIIDRQPTVQPECDYIIGLLHDNSTIIWQPLPKPWKGGQDG